MIAQRDARDRDPLSFTSSITTVTSVATQPVVDNGERRITARVVRACHAPRSCGVHFLDHRGRGSGHKEGDS